MAAIRRCAGALPGRHLTEKYIANPHSTANEESPEDSAHDAVTSVSILPEIKDDDSEEVKLLRAFVAANPTCVECNSQPVT